MAIYVAFLRGINVGGHRVQMATLRAAFEALGFDDVRTFIASGNVIFDGGRSRPATLEARIEAHLAGALGFAAPPVLRTPAELRRVIADVPFDASDRARAHAVHVIFMREPLDATTAGAIEALSTPRDRLVARGREIYWWCGGLLSETLVPDRALARALGPRVTTMRNLTMLEKLAATV